MRVTVKNCVVRTREEAFIKCSKLKEKKEEGRKGKKGEEGEEARHYLREQTQKQSPVCKNACVVHNS